MWSDIAWAYIPIGIFVTGIYRVTPEGRYPSSSDAPNFACVIGWPFLVFWFSWWMLFSFLPDSISWVCKWLITYERKPKKLLPDDEVQKILVGELKKPQERKN